jgi:DNA-binding response OmpR family regulator
MPKVTLRPPYRVTVEGVVHKITPSEHNVLMALMGKRVCSREDLAQAIWPLNAIRPLTMRSCTHLTRLRKVLEGHWAIRSQFNRGWYLEKEGTL